MADSQQFMAIGIESPVCLVPGEKYQPLLLASERTRASKSWWLAEGAKVGNVRCMDAAQVAHRH